jgi:hypothetical protein
LDISLPNYDVSWNGFAKEFRFYNRKLVVLTARLNETTEPDYSSSYNSSDDDDDQVYKVYCDNTGKMFNSKKEWKAWLKTYNERKKREKALKRAEGDKLQPLMANFITHQTS